MQLAGEKMVKSDQKVKSRNFFNVHKRFKTVSLGLVLLNESDPIRGFGSNPGFGGFESILTGLIKFPGFFIM